jgi:hypothetical protein
VEVQLPQRLEEVLAAITDRELGIKLRRVCEAAAQAIERLGHLNLLKLEPASSEDGSADLSAWEQMAPAIAETITDANELIRVIDVHFPDDGRAAADYASFSDERTEAEAGQVFRAVATQLELDVAEVGGMMRNGKVLGSGWALLGELQRLRAKFRSRVGDAVYLSAAACARVVREDVVPGFLQELARAALFRSTSSDVRRSVDLKLTGSTAEPRTLARQIEVDFDIFSTLPTWRHVRAEPKRRMLQVRESLRRGSADAALSHHELKQLVDPALTLLRQLSEEKTQKLLANHDRNAAMIVEQLLGQAQLHLELKTGVGPAAFAMAIKACNELYGRDGDFDAFLRSTRGKTYHELTTEQLESRVLDLRLRIGALQV